MQNVIFYHGNCNDGFGAYWAFLHATRGNPEYESQIGYEVDHYKAFPLKNITPDTKRVIFLDYAPERGLINSIRDEMGKQILVIDHHLKPVEAIRDLLSPDELYFDNDRSGAGLAWDYFTDLDLPRPDLVKYLEDYDLWKYQLPMSRAINAFIRSKDRTIENYDNLNVLISSAFDQTSTIGMHIYEAEQKVVKELAKHAFKVSFKGIQGYAVNCPTLLANEVCDRILADTPDAKFAMYFNQSDKRMGSGFRSRKDGLINVQVIAAHFGGSGHATASGAKLSLDSGLSMVYSLIQGVPEETP